MLSMLSMFFYFMVVVGSTVAMLRNSDSSSSSSKVRNLNEPLSAKETFIKELILNNINDSVDPCEDFYQYACGDASYNKKHSWHLETKSKIDNHVLSILNSHPAIIRYQNTCQEDLKSAPRLPTLIKDTITKIENSKDVPSIMAIVGTLVRETGVKSILLSEYISPTFLKNGELSSHFYFDLGIDIQLSKTNSQFKTYVDDLLVTNKILSHEELEQIPVIISKESLLKVNVNNTLKQYLTEDASSLPMINLLNRYPNTIRPLLQNLFPGKNSKNLLLHPKLNNESFVVMDKFLTTSSFSTVKKVFKYAIVHEVVKMQPQSQDSIDDIIEKFCKEETTKLFLDVIDEEYKKQFIDPKAFSVAKTITDSILEEAKLTLNKKDSLLDESTRKVFAKKINSIKTHIGVPEIPGTQKKKALKDTTTYIGMKLELAGIEYSRLCDSLGTQLPPWEVNLRDSENNARYRFFLNDVVVYSGKLQSPMFQVDYPLVMQYGLLGRAFAHEVTHSIDPESIEYTGAGHFNGRWYSNQTSKDDFDERAKCFVDFYSKLRITNDKGELTRNMDGNSILQENIAINGLQLAYSAFMRAGDTEDILGYPANKLFYLSYAKNICQPLPSDEVINAPTNSEYPFAKERINGNLMLDPYFAKVFQCSATSTLNPKQKCNNWWGNQ